MFLFISSKLLVLCLHEKKKKVQPEPEMSVVRLSNGMPRQTAPLPSSPPPRLDVSTLDQLDQGGKFSFTLLNDLPAYSIYCLLYVHTFVADVFIKASNLFILEHMLEYLNVLIFVFFWLTVKN